MGPGGASRPDWPGPARGVEPPKKSCLVVASSARTFFKMSSDWPSCKNLSIVATNSRTSRVCQTERWFRGSSTTPVARKSFLLMSRWFVLLGAVKGRTGGEVAPRGLAGVLKAWRRDRRQFPPRPIGPRSGCAGAFGIGDGPVASGRFAFRLASRSSLRSFCRSSRGICCFMMASIFL